MARVRAQLDALEVDLDKSSLKAPFNGRIAKRHLDEGTTVAAGDAVLSLLETATLEVRVGVSPRVASQWSPGDAAILRTLDDMEVNATAKTVLPQRDARTRTVDVVFALKEAPLPLRDGDLLELQVDREITETGFWLPRTALTESARNLWGAYVAVPDEDWKDASQPIHRLDRRHLEVVHLEGDRVFVRGAISDGDQVVIGGLQRFVPGQLVTDPQL